ncbi:MAG TPA: glycerophosphodiester phosphodiesterase [Oligoflexus sp.]|uniref:glycerophosphodiester phosphodiesterase n=1 Tax=Oligoflexus sp. TaxID=1971216 RepID=UPI002D7F09B9|nr:glycerophosphodiester phosphodiesterase [Oligoflexus sp.]HET9238750.1 glycerophosphodiester phosphodiesterase [Oligoflexus sp.]
MEQDPVVWISHRGYHTVALENTREAFDAAIEAGFTHLETDLRTTADGHIVLHHDSELTRTFANSLIVEKTSLRELLSLRSPHGHRLLTFDEFIESYAGFSWTFDIKPESAGPTLLGLHEWARRKKAESWLNEQARFLCWSARAERYLRQLFPNARTLAREAECYRAGLAVFSGMPFVGGIRSGRTYSIPRYFAGRDLFTKFFAEAYHKRGARLLAYLPVRDEDAKAAVDAGFDEILTNHLPLSMT